MNINQLNYFVTIAQQSSMRKAAETLYISQPSLTNSIHNMEQELGYSLFERSSSGMNLTAIGKQALIFATDILETYNKLKNLSLLNQVNPIRTNFTIYTISTMSFSYLSTVSNLFQNFYPNVLINVHEDAPKGILNALFSGTCDMGIVLCAPTALPDEVIGNPDIICKELFISPVYAIMNGHHPLAHNKTLSVNKLLHYPIAIHSANNTDFHTINSIFADKHPVIKLRSNNVNFIYNYITENNCIAISFKFLQSLDEIAIKNLVFIPIKSLYSGFYAIYLKSSPKKALIESYLDILVSNISSDNKYDDTGKR